MLDVFNRVDKNSRVSLTRSLSPICIANKNQLFYLISKSDQINVAFNEIDIINTRPLA